MPSTASHGSSRGSQCVAHRRLASVCGHTRPQQARDGKGLKQHELAGRAINVTMGKDEVSLLQASSVPTPVDLTGKQEAHFSSREVTNDLASSEMSRHAVPLIRGLSAKMDRLRRRLQRWFCGRVLAWNPMCSAEDDAAQQPLLQDCGPAPASQCYADFTIVCVACSTRRSHAVTTSSSG